MKLRKLSILFYCSLILTGFTCLSAIGSQGEEVCEIYIFNISGWTLIPSDQELFDNGKPLVSLPRQTYKQMTIPVGMHEFVLHGRKLDLETEHGKTYYIAMGYKPGRSWAFPLGGDPVCIKQISAEDAQTLLQQFTTP